MATVEEIRADLTAKVGAPVANQFVAISSALTAGKALPTVEANLVAQQAAVASLKAAIAFLDGLRT